MPRQGHAALDLRAPGDVVSPAATRQEPSSPSSRRLIRRVVVSMRADICTIDPRKASRRTHSAETLRTSPAGAASSSRAAAQRSLLASWWKKRALPNV